MSVLDFIVLTLAGSAVVETWFQGSIFATARAYLEAVLDSDDYAEDEDAPPQRLPRLARFLSGKFAELMMCPFCLSHHTPWVIALVFFLPATLVDVGWIAFCMKLPAYSLAATRLGNLVNAFAPTSADYQR